MVEEKRNTTLVTKRGKYLLFIACYILFLLNSSSTCIAQPALETPFAGEEEYMSIAVSVQGVGTTEIPAVIRDRWALLSITSLFDYLKIKHQVSQSVDSVTGVFLGDPFVISFDQKVIYYKNETHKLSINAIIKSEAYLYLQTEYISSIFKLPTLFNFRGMTVNIIPNVELPVIAEKRRDAMRVNRGKLTGMLNADTLYKQTYPLFKLGMMDWSVTSIQQQNAASQTYGSVNVGAMVAGGETNIGVNYNSQEGFRRQQQYYLWRRVDNDNPFLRQISLGKVNAMATATIFRPVVGAQISNSPTYLRKSVGTYVLSDIIQPNWVVELYVNNVLVDYQKTDISGFYKFNVPLVYGVSHIKLRFYGPWGEERTQTQYINVPFVFLPKGKFEYTATGGIVEDTGSSRFAKVIGNYGITNNIKIGSGVEYLSSVSSGKYMPYVNANVLIGKKLMLFGEYTYGVRGLGALNFRTSSDFQAEVNYVKYVPGQTAIRLGFVEERKIILSKPFRKNNYNFFSRLTYNQIVLSFTDYSIAEWLVTGNYRFLGVNLNTHSLISNRNLNLYTNASLTFRLPKNYLVTSQVIYQYDVSKLVSYKAILEKYVLNSGYISFTYERNILNNLRNLTLDLRYDFSAGQIITSAKHLNNQFLVTNTARGSILYDKTGNYFDFDSRTANGRGGIVIIPFVDINNNGLRDPNEPLGTGLKASVNGGRVIYDKEGYVRIFDLERYTTYQIVLDDATLNNISWRIKKKILNVIVEPNHFRDIYVPITTQAEISGFVYLGTDEQNRIGQKQILLHVKKDDSTVITSLLSESDGYFVYLGLSPGNYTLALDEKQLSKLGFTATPSQIPITIKENVEGDVIDDISFTLQNSSNIEEFTKETKKKDIPKDTVVSKNYTEYIIQAGAFRNRDNAVRLFEKIKKLVDKDVRIEKRDDLFIINISGFENYRTAKISKQQLQRMKIASIIIKTQ